MRIRFLTSSASICSTKALYTIGVREHRQKDGMPDELIETCNNR